jgi:hypothetical protein
LLLPLFGDADRLLMVVRFSSEFSQAQSQATIDIGRPFVQLVQPVEKRVLMDGHGLDRALVSAIQLPQQSFMLLPIGFDLCRVKLPLVSDLTFASLSLKIQLSFSMRESTVRHFDLLFSLAKRCFTSLKLSLPVFNLFVARFMVLFGGDL